MIPLEQVSFFLTQQQPCSYLPGQTSQSICLDPQQPIETRLFSLLAQQGFRRSGQFTYRPHCPACNACVPIRVPVQHFTPTKQQQRTLKRGEQLSVLERTPAHTDEYYQLYAHYINQRHADGEMYPPSTTQFANFLTQALPFSRFYEFRLADRLMAVAVTDCLSDGLSAVYSFFDPDDRYYSLGRYAVLWQIQHAQALQLPYLYLGYWIKDCQKMNYKTQYQPIEGFIDGQWRPLPTTLL